MSLRFENCRILSLFTFLHSTSSVFVAEVVHLYISGSFYVCHLAYRSLNNWSDVLCMCAYTHADQSIMYDVQS